MLTLNYLAGMLFLGLALLGFGTALGNQRSVGDAGLAVVPLVFKGAGLAVLSYALYRFVHVRMGW